MEVNSFMGREIPFVKEPSSEDANEDDEGHYLVVLPRKINFVFKYQRRDYLKFSCFVSLENENKCDDLEGKGAVGGSNDDRCEFRNPASGLSPASSALKHRSYTDELREIISEVKNQRLDVRQAEIAFEAWKQRKDVQEDSDKRKVSLFLLISNC